MIALSSISPIHESLLSHFFGHLGGARKEDAVSVLSSVSSHALMATSVDEDEEFPDLAQRVRDVGEW